MVDASTPLTPSVPVPKNAVSWVAPTTAAPIKTISAPKRTEADRVAPRSRIERIDPIAAADPTPAIAIIAICGRINIRPVTPARKIATPDNRAFALRMYAAPNWSNSIAMIARGCSDG